MIDTTELHESLRRMRGYRGVQLALYVLEHADDSGTYVAPSKVHIRRLLARGGQEEAKVVDVFTAVRQLIAQGVLHEDSDSQTFHLVGGSR